MKTITIDPTCACWIPNTDILHRHLEVAVNHIADTLRYRGYIYLNQIYEKFGAPWNPDWDNVCYRSSDGKLRANIMPGLGDVYFIEIYQ